MIQWQTETGTWIPLIFEASSSFGPSKELILANRIHTAHSVIHCKHSDAIMEGSRCTKFHVHEQGAAAYCKHLLVNILKITFSKSCWQVHVFELEKHLLNNWHYQPARKRQEKIRTRTICANTCGNIGWNATADTVSVWPVSLCR